MEANIFKNLMHIKYKWTKIWVLGQASRFMRPARPDILWQWRNMWGSILFVLQIYFMKYYLNLARSTKKFTGMFQQLRPKFQLLVGREIIYVPTV